MTLRRLNPDTLHANPAFSQGVLIEGPGALLVVGGQNGVDATGAVVSNDFGEQSAQAMRNVLAMLGSVGASQADVAKLTIYMLAGSDVMQGYAATQEVWGATRHRDHGRAGRRLCPPRCSR